MKALVYTGPEKVEIQAVPDPQVREGEVLLKVGAAGICGSDIHGFLGHSERRKPGLVMGHETVATILELDPAVRGWRKGQRVCFNPLVSCMKCGACAAGRQNLCTGWWLFGMDRVHGTYAEYVSVPASQLHPLSDALTDKEAILVEPLANICHFFRISMDGVPDTMAVWGGGTIGALALVLAKLRGISRVIVVDTNEGRLEVARKLGADVVVNARTEDPVKAVRGHTEGLGAEYVVETAGIEPARRAAVAAGRRGGRVLFIGMAQNDSALPWVEMIRNEQAIFTTFAYAPRDFATSLRLIESRQFDLASWTDALPLERGQEGFMKMTHAPGPTLKLMFTV